MNTKKRCALAILTAIALILPDQAAVNVIVNTDAVAVDAADANMTPGGRR